MNPLQKVIVCLILLGLAGCQKPDDVDPVDAVGVRDNAAAAAGLQPEPAGDGPAQADSPTAVTASAATVEVEPGDVEIEDDGREWRVEGRH